MDKKEKVQYSEVLGSKVVGLMDYISTIREKKTNSSTVETNTVEPVVNETQPNTVNSAKEDLNKSPNGVYLDWENKRMLIKDAMFTLSMLGFIVFALWIAVNKDSFMVPNVRYPDGTVLEGNCSFIWDEFNALKQRSGVGLVCPTGEKCDPFSGNVKFILPNTTLPTYALYTTTSTLPACEPVIIEKNITRECPKQTCPEPPACVCECPYETGLTKVQTFELVNIMKHIPPNNSPAFSGGCAACLRMAWDAVDIPYCEKGATDTRYCQPRFNPAPSTEYYNRMIDSSFGGVAPTKDLFCFPDLGGYFIINRTSYMQGSGNVTRHMFGWNDEQCSESYLRVNDL